MARRRPRQHAAASVAGSRPAPRLTGRRDSVNDPRFRFSLADKFMRILIAALFLCALSFAAGVAGDLSTAPAPHGERVVAAIPPPVPVPARAPKPEQRK
jgi:hypothetical protein